MASNRRPRLKAKLENSFAVFCLLVTSWAILGTSVGTHSVRNGRMTLKSDCPGAIREGQIHATSGAIDEPVGQTFLDYGFPLAVLPAGDSVTGFVGGIERTCTRTVGSETEGNDWVYSCYEQGEFMCSIYAQRTAY